MTRTDKAIGTAVLVTIALLVYRHHTQAETEPPEPAWEIGQFLWCELEGSTSLINEITDRFYGTGSWYYELSSEGEVIGTFSEQELLDLECLIAA